MIVPMKKIHLVVQKKDAFDAVERLRAIGCVHVEHLDPLVGQEVEKRREEVRILRQIIERLSALKISVDQQPYGDDWREAANILLKTIADSEHYEESCAKRAELIKEWAPWGDFHPEDIRALRDRGLQVELVKRSVKDKRPAPAGVILKDIFTQGGIIYGIAVSREPVELHYEIIPMPSMSLKELNDLQHLEKNIIEEKREHMTKFACYEQFFRDTLLERENALRYEEVLVGMKDDEQLMVMKGFVPEDQVRTLEQKANAEKWGLLIEDPSPSDVVPTLLKNAKPAELTKPALDMIEILPGYKEVDVSVVFLIFFTLFFGMLIGDAAYGAIFFGLTALAHWKLGKKLDDKKPFYLMYLLTFFTCVWGVLTGTYFGQQWLPGSVSPIVPWLNDIENIQWFCFAIAVVHLSIAHIWNGVLRFPNITFLSEVGWLMIVWGMFFLANYFVLNMAFPPFAKWLFIVGVPLALFFMVPPKELLKTVPQELIPFVLSVVGAGTDIISYIRLFAVGLATVAVADAANTMPNALPYGIGYGFMVFLHVLNMILAAMAILVHAIRLNVLEFSGHLRLEWAGVKYSPFKQLHKA